MTKHRSDRFLTDYHGRSRLARTASGSKGLFTCYYLSAQVSLLPQENEAYRRSAAFSGPIEDVGPMEESFIGGFRTQPPSSPHPPPLPPKDYTYHAPQHQHHQSTISTSQLAHLSAVERSQTLRVARMEPHLQVYSPHSAYSIYLIFAVYVWSSSKVGPTF